MKLIRFYAILTLLAAILFGIFYCDDAKEQFQRRSLQKQKGEILPEEKWMETFVGEWDVSFTLRNPSGILDVNGTTIINEDSTYYDDWKFSYYNHYSANTVKIHKDYLNLSGIMQRSGKFSSFTSKHINIPLFRRVDDCQIEPTYKKPVVGVKIDFCLMVYPIVNRPCNCGYDSGCKEVRSEVLEFTHNRIRIKINSNKVEKPIFLSFIRKLE